MDGDRVRTSQAQRMSDIKHERGVTLAHVVPTENAIWCEYLLKSVIFKKMKLEQANREIGK
jgi:hypothetical protein